MSAFTGKKDYFWFYINGQTYLFRQSREEIDYENQLLEDSKRAIEDYFDMVSAGEKSVTECLEFLMLDIEKLRNRSES